MFLDIRGLNYFIAALEYLNFTRAARECHITQTAMSQYIARIEDELGFQLFYRNNRSVTPTPAGRDFYDRARRILLSYEEALQHGLSLAAGETGEVLVIAPSSIEALFIIERLKGFQRQFPKVRLNLRVVEPRHIMGMIKEGVADLAICWPYDFAADETLGVLPIASFEILAVVRAASPEARAERLSAKAISGKQVALLEPGIMQNTYRAMRHDWLANGLEPAGLIRLQKLEDILLEVELNDALALVPAFVREHVAGGLAFKKLDLGQPIRMEVAACYLPDNLNPAVARLLDSLKADAINHSS